jgi:hypothetical protein
MSCTRVRVVAAGHTFGILLPRYSASSFTAWRAMGAD